MPVIPQCKSEVACCSFPVAIEIVFVRVAILLDLTLPIGLKIVFCSRQDVGYMHIGY
jgi:hypothetical protein